jgi:bacterioferritin
MKRSEKADLITGLNEDLAHEYASIIQYRTFASTVRGPHRLTLRPLFTGETADELAHAELLADAIVALGGTPTVDPAPVAVAEGPEEMLQQVLEAERAALARYVERHRQAEALGEHALAVALDTVIADETRHRDELHLVLAGWMDTTRDRAFTVPSAPRESAGASASSAARRQPAHHDVTTTGDHDIAPPAA